MNNTATADGIAYRLVRELEDLIELAGTAMRQANADGSEYEVEDELASARLAVESYKTFCGETKGGSNAGLHRTSEAQHNQKGSTE